MMDPEVKAKWLAALRGEGEYAGKYKQGVGALRMDASITGSAHCCLGVLCDLLDPNGWSSSSDTTVGAVSHRKSCAVPTRDVYLAAGFKVWPAELDMLISMNDRNGASFSEIADYIEEKL